MTYQYDIHGTRSLAHRSSGSVISYMVVVISFKGVNIITEHYVCWQTVPFTDGTNTEKVFPSLGSTVWDFDFQLVTSSHHTRATSNYSEELGVVNVLNSVNKLEDLNKITPSSSVF